MSAHDLHASATGPAGLLTVGHFLDLLAAHRVEAVADVRSWPASRHAPWFDRTPLAGALRD